MKDAQKASLSPMGDLYALPQVRKVIEGEGDDAVRCY